MTTCRVSLVAGCIAVGLFGVLVGSCASNGVDRAVRDANGDTEKTGNPYRAHVTDMGPAGKLIEFDLIGTPAPTVADQILKNDVLARIGELESKSGIAATSTLPVLLQTRFVSKSAEGIAEVWVIAREKSSVAYTVSFKDSPKGGVDFKVRGPWHD